MFNGMINVYKEEGYTSHDVVAKLRGILHQKKIGHTGTLDPQAVGVLPVCLGKGTKLCDMLTNKDKTYVAVMRLGIKTDTQDMTGTILSQKEVNVSEEQVRDAVMSFVGDYEQIPPMYSALKVNGKKLYELARDGIEVERKARAVKIHSINIIEINDKLVEMEVSCSKGTYIRTLCEDIGEKLGCGACMQQLTRTKVSDFTIDKSLKLSEIEELVRADKLEEFIVAPDMVFLEYEKAVVLPEYERFLYNGNQLKREAFDTVITGEKIRVYDTKGVFAGVYEYKENKGHYAPEKMFLG